MRAISVLIIWCLPLLQIGVHGQSPSHGRAPGTHRARTHVSSPVLHRTRDLAFPEDPSGRSLRISAAEEEDSVEDGSFGDGLLLSRFWRDLERGEFSSLARLPHDRHRSPSCPHPLRC